MAARAWFEKIADTLEQRAAVKIAAGEAIVCASGISPSGTIHLGNLREVMTVHLVAEELRSRGHQVEHIHSWDDFDRLRKIPAGVDESFSEHLGRPLAEVPDPWGEHASWAERHIAEFERCLARLGVTARFVRQSQAYPSGIYRESIQQAMAERGRIFDILAEHQAAERHDLPVEERRRAYYPFRVYCRSCRRDDTEITAYEPATATVTYRCACGEERSFSLDDEVPGKLVWKVDWPMRWQFEGVDFEPGGEDHSSPGGSFTVGKRIVREVFGGEPPFYVGYAFVGVSGASKISSSAGTEATPGTALDIIEPCILRWLYMRRNVGQSFTIDFGPEMLRLYDEWDAFRARAAAAGPDDANAKILARCLATSGGPVDGSAAGAGGGAADSDAAGSPVACTPLPVSFRLLSSAADLTQGNRDQMLRIVAEHLDSPPPPDELARQVEPRLTCAANWTERFVPDAERTRVNEGFDRAVWESLSDDQRAGARLLAERLDAAWTLDGLTALVYGVPKLLRDLPLDHRPAKGDPRAEELKAAQRDFFSALYRLLVGSETGPRLPTLLLSIGRERVRELLVPPAG
ncbi:MAG TPA: lysine--tRNA ligase [Thermoanaerobaculia bacterium]|nr:lysine--tRNA ligase [Thermoanaerobaculia bacterium]